MLCVLETAGKSSRTALHLCSLCLSYLRSFKFSKESNLSIFSSMFLCFLFGCVCVCVLLLKAIPIPGLYTKYLVISQNALTIFLVL